MNNTVGKSISRTPFKHWVLDHELGRLAGVLGRTNKTPAEAKPFHIIDLCAGDGETTEEHQSSPSIILKHAQYFNDMVTDGRWAKVTLIEKSAHTFYSLLSNVDPPAYVEMLNQDAVDFELIPACENQAIFIHADPNCISEWPISENLIRSLTPTTTMLATLGCNVGGLKRLPIGDRSRWFDYIEQAVSVLASWHDILLFRLENDAAQWAYLLRLPKKWSERTAETILTKGRKFTAYDISIVSMRDDYQGFRMMQRELFLTRKELANEN